VCANQCAHTFDRYAPGRRHSLRLNLGRRRRDVRVQAAAARGDHFGRHLAGRDAFLLHHSVEALPNGLQMIRI
jgi:hypothetical protein